MATNITTAVFSSASSYGNASGLWQYDYGQVLRIQGLNLPKAVEIHFSLTEFSGNSITRIGTTKDGVTDVIIPDSMLENGDTGQNYNIYAFIFLTNSDSGNTEYRIKIPVKARPKPEIPGTPEEPEIFRETVEAVKQAAVEADQSRDSAAGYAQSAEASRKAAAQSEQNINAQTADFDTKVSESVTQAQEEIATARRQAINAITAQETKSETEVKRVGTAALTSAEQALREIETTGQQAVQAVTDQQNTSVQAVKDETKSYIEEKKQEISAKTNEVTQAVNQAGEEQLQNIADSLDSTLTESGKAADAAAVGKKARELSTDLNLLKEYVKGMNLPETWEQVVLAIKSKLHKEMYVAGDRFGNIWKDTNNSNKEYDNPLRINHFEDGLELEDGTTVNGMWLQTVYAHLKGVQFSHQQAFYVSDEGMTAGTYCIGFDYTWGSNGYVNKGDYWNFTLTKDVPAGGKLAGCYAAPDTDPKNWRIYTYSADGKTVLETVSTVNKGQEGTLIGVMTAYGNENLNGIQQMAYGDNRYATSAIRQYLNSDKPKGEWWTAQTKWDVAPDQLSQIDGYLCGMDSKLLAVLQPVKVVTYCNTVTTTGQKQIKDVTYDKVTLISLEQMYIEPQVTGEGEVHEYYKELNGTAKKFQWWQAYEILKTFAVENPTSPQNVRLRSASRDNACSTWIVSSSGYDTHSSASNAFRPAPLMFIGAAPSDTISAPTDAENAQETVV